MITLEKRVREILLENRKSGRGLRRFSALFTLIFAMPIFASDTLTIPPLRLTSYLGKLPKSVAIMTASETERKGLLLRSEPSIEVANFQNLISLDLLQIYQLAKDEDATYAVARAEFTGNREKVSQARAGYLPILNASASVAKAVNAQQGLPRSRYASDGYSISLMQPLIRPQVWANFRQAKQQVLQAEHKLSAANQELILRVAKAYFDVLLAQDNVKVSQAQKTAFERQLEQARKTFEVGTTTITDANEAQAKYDQAVAKEIADQNDLRIKSDVLRQIIAKVPPRLSSLRDNVTFDQFVSDNLNEWEKTAETDNQTIAISKADAEIAKLEVTKQRAGHLPVLDLIMSYTDNRNGIGNIFGGRADFRSTQIGLQLTIPFYSGGGVSSKVSEALALQQRAQSDLEQKRRDSLQAVRTAFLGVNSGASKIKSLEQAVKSSQVSYESTKLGREVGVRTTIDLLNAEQQVFEAQRDLSQAKYELLINRLNLLASAGKLTEEDITKLNDIFEK